MTKEFNKWWNEDLLSQDNPYVDGTAAFWAWEGWQAALAQPEQEPVAYSYTSRITGAQGFSHHPMPRFVDSESWDIKPLYTQNYTHIPSPKQKVVGWKLVPIKPTDEMLKAMDECSTEGYDERLYAGHAASVYMAAVDVAPTPPQRKPEQEPCTKVECMGSKGCIGNCWNKKQPQQELVCVCGAVWEGEELIYTPPQRKPLTDEEMQRMAKRIEELEAMLEQQTARIVDLQTHIANLEGE